MMTKIWKECVLTPTVEDALSRTLEEALKELHQDLVQHVLDKSPQGDSSAIELIVGDFFNSIADLSLNETTVHFSHSSEVMFDPLYLRYEEQLKLAHTAFVKKLVEVAQKKHRIAMLPTVLKEYARFFNRHYVKTHKELQKNQSEVIIKFTRYLLKLRAKKFGASSMEKVDKKLSPCDR